MNFVWDISNKKEVVRLVIDINVKAEKLFVFEFTCADEVYAELLVNHLKRVYSKFQEYVCKNPLEFLPSKEISKLKRFLNEHWDAKNHCYK